MKTSYGSRARFALAVAMAGAVCAAARTAGAQAKGFAIDRFEPSERGSEWFTTESLDLRGHLRVAAGIVNDGAIRPLAIYNKDGSLDTSIVRDQIFVHVGGSLILIDRIRVSIGLPVAVHEGGETGILDGVTYQPPRSFAVGDLRLGSDVRLVGVHGDPFTMAAGVRLFLPTGSRRDFTSDGSVRVQPRVVGAGEVGAFVYSAQVGFEYRGLDDRIASTKLGSELTFGAAAGARLANKNLVLGPEFFGSTILTGGSPFSEIATPLGVLLGFHYSVSELRFGGGFGAGLTSGLGSPVARWAVSVEWAPEPRRVYDRDGDGIADSADACPDEAGPRTNDSQTSGCPAVPAGPSPGAPAVDRPSSPVESPSP